MFISIDRLNFCSQKFKSRLAAELYICICFLSKENAFISIIDTCFQLYGWTHTCSLRSLYQPTKNGYLLDGLGRDTLNDKTMTNDERFICKLYSNNETYMNINDVRFKMFEKGTKESEKFPPTQSSLRLHIKRAHYQCTIWLRLLLNLT